MMRINLAAFRLSIGTKLTADIRALIILETKPAQTIHDLPFCTGDGSFQVSIFNTQNELPACLFREQVIIESDTGSSKVHMPSWRWRNASSCRFGGQENTPFHL